MPFAPPDISDLLVSRRRPGAPAGDAGGPPDIADLLAERRARSGATAPTADSPAPADDTAAAPAPAGTAAAIADDGELGPKVRQGGPAFEIPPAARARVHGMMLAFRRVDGDQSLTPEELAIAEPLMPAVLKLRAEGIDPAGMTAEQMPWAGRLSNWASQGLGAGSAAEKTWRSLTANAGGKYGAAGGGAQAAKPSGPPNPTTLAISGALGGPGTPEEQAAAAQVGEHATGAEALVGSLPAMGISMADPQQLALMLAAHVPASAMLASPVVKGTLAAIADKSPLAARIVGAELAGASNVGIYSGLDAATKADWTDPESATAHVVAAIGHGAATGMILAGPHAIAGAAGAAGEAVGRKRAARAGESRAAFREAMKGVDAAGGRVNPDVQAQEAEGSVLPVIEKGGSRGQENQGQEEGLLSPQSSESGAEGGVVTPAPPRPPAVGDRVLIPDPSWPDQVLEGTVKGERNLGKGPRLQVMDRSGRRHSVDPADVQLVGDEPPAAENDKAEPEDKAPEKHEFSTTQVDLPAELGDQVKAAAGKIADEDLAPDGREERPHITVKYGLHTDDPAKVAEVLKGEGPIEVTLGPTSLFKNDEHEVVKADVEGEGLHALNAKIAGALEHTDTHPDYKPHVTLGYVKPGKSEKYVGDDALKGKTATIDRVVFSGKDGKQTVIELGGGTAEGGGSPEGDTSAPAAGDLARRRNLSPATLKAQGFERKKSGNWVRRTEGGPAPRVEGASADEANRIAAEERLTPEADRKSGAGSAYSRIVQLAMPEARLRLLEAAGEGEEVRGPEARRVAQAAARRIVERPGEQTLADAVAAEIDRVKTPAPSGGKESTDAVHERVPEGPDAEGSSRDGKPVRVEVEGPKPEGGGGGRRRGRVKEGASGQGKEAAAPLDGQGQGLLKDEAGSAAKRPWEMTAREYLDSPATAGWSKRQRRGAAGAARRGGPALAAEIERIEAGGKGKANHGLRLAVERAAQAGEPVPAEVLAEHPSAKVKPKGPAAANGEARRFEELRSKSYRELRADAERVGISTPATSKSGLAAQIQERELRAADPSRYPPAERVSAETGKPITKPEDETLFSRLTSKADEIAARRRARQIPRGPGVGATTLYDDIVDVAHELALRAVAAGIKGGKQLRAFIAEQLKEEPAAVRQARQSVAAAVRGFLRRATREDGTIDGDKLLDMRRVVEQEPETVKASEALKARLGGEVKAGAAGVKVGEAREKNRAATAAQDAGPQVSLGEAIVARMRGEATGRRQGRREALVEARGKLEGLADQARRRRSMAAIEQRGAAAAARGKMQDRADVENAIRDGLTKLVNEKLPAAIRGKFTTEIRDATTKGRFVKAIERMRHALADYEVKEAMGDTANAAKRARPKQMGQEYRDVVRKASEQLKSLSKQVQRMTELNDKLAAAAEAKDLGNTIKEAVHRDKFEKEVRVAGKVRQREDVVTSAVTSVEKKPEIKVAPGLGRTRKAPLLGRATQAHLTADTMGVVLGDPSLRNLLSENLWDGETLVNRDTQSGIDAMKANLKKAGYEWGSDRLQRLSEEAAGVKGARAVTMDLPDAGRHTATPAEWMGLYATLTDSMAGRNIEQGVPITWARDKRGKALTLTPDDAAAVKAQLDPELRAVVDDSKQHVEAAVRPALFAAHRRLKGFEPEAVPGYWRTRRNQDQREAPRLNESMMAHVNRVLENMGFLKEREGGKTPYIIGDFFGDYHQIIHQAAAVTHMAERVRDAEMVFRDPRLSRAIETRYGEGMNGRIDDIIESAKLLFPEPRTGFEKAASWMSKNFGRAKLTANPGTWLKQIGGVMKLGAQLEPAHFRAGLAGMLNKGVRERMLDSPFFRDRYEGAIWRRATPSMFERGPLLGEGSAVDALKRGLTINPVKAWAAAGELADKIKVLNWFDSLSASAAWAAKEAEAKAKGVPEAERPAWVAREAERLVRRTQNTHSPLDMSAFARSQRGRMGASALLMFSSDNNKAMNMMVSALHDPEQSTRKTLAYLAADWAWAALVATGMGSVGIKAAVRQFTGNDRPDREQSFGEALARNFGANVTASVYGLDRAWGAAMTLVDQAMGRKVDAKKAADNAVTGPVEGAAKELLEGLADVAIAFQEDGDFKSGPRRGENRMWDKISTGLESAGLAGADILGLPVSPMYRKVAAGLRAARE